MLIPFLISSFLTSSNNRLSNGYDIEFKCKNKKEVLQVIDQLAKDFEKEKHQ